MRRTGEKFQFPFLETLTLQERGCLSLCFHFEFFHEHVKLLFLLCISFRDSKWAGGEIHFQSCRTFLRSHKLIQLFISNIQGIVSLCDSLLKVLDRFQNRIHAPANQRIYDAKCLKDGC
jgi:hypothetical protein